MRRLYPLILLLLAFLITIPRLEAVEKETSVDQTIQSLDAELSKKLDNLPKEMIRFDSLRNDYMTQRTRLKSKLDELAVVLYSQSYANFFSLTYYCQKIAAINATFHGKQFPFNKFRAYISNELKKLSQLKQALENIDPSSLSAAGKAARENAIRNCDELSSGVTAFDDQIRADEELFIHLGHEIEILNTYANGNTNTDNVKKLAAAKDTLPVEQQKTEPATANTTEAAKIDTLPAPVSEILNTAQKVVEATTAVKAPSIMPSPGEDGQMYEMMNQAFWQPNALSFDIISIWPSFIDAVQNTYLQDNGTVKTRELRMLCLYFVIFLVASYLISRLIFHVFLKSLLAKRNSLPKMPFYTLAGTFILLSLSFLSVNAFQDLDVMTSITLLGTEFFMIIAAIILSLTIRLPHARLWGGFRVYAPMIILCAIFVFLRMSMAPNIIINFSLPFIFLFITVINSLIGWKMDKNLPMLDRSLCSVSLIVTIAGTIASFKGYCFMSFLCTLIWIMLMSSILFVTAISQLLHQFQARFNRNQTETGGTWFHILVTKLAIPLLSVGLIVYSFLWPANIFDMTHMLMDWASKAYSINDVVKELSVNNILIIIIIAIVLNYLISLGKHTLHEIYKDQYETGAIPTFITLSSFALWGIFILTALSILHADYHGLLMVMGGMSMGIGFALKDTIDNIICGLSLMFGRLRQGDIVECDGIRGQVSSIGYRTTFIETMDGSIIAFQNNQLFNKNFRNLTRNHLYECIKVEIGIPYGVSVERARQLVLEATRKVETLSPIKSTLVVLDKFGDSSVDLGVWVWVPVRTKASTLSRVRENIYQAFNENGIEIPFPQQDVYIKSFPGHAHAVQQSEPSPSKESEDTDHSSRSGSPDTIPHQVQSTGTIS